MLEEIEREAGKDAAAVAQSLIEWAEDRNDGDIEYGVDSAKCKLTQDGAVLLRPFRIYSNGRAIINFLAMRNQPPFDRPEMRSKLREVVNEAVLDGDLLPAHAEWEPSFALDVLSDEQARQRFIAAVEWAFEKARRAQLGPPQA